MLDRIRSIRDRTLSPVRHARGSKSSSRPASSLQASGDRSTPQTINSGIPLDRLGSPIPGESSHEAQTFSTLPPISTDSHTASSARFLSLDVQRDFTIPVIQVVDSSVDVLEDVGDLLSQSIDETPAPAPVSLAAERRGVAYEAFKTTLGMLNEVSDGFPPLKLAAAGLLNVITILEVRGISVRAVLRRRAQVTRQRAVQNDSEFNNMTKQLNAILTILNRYKQHGLQSAVKDHLQELSEFVNVSRYFIR